MEKILSSILLFLSQQYLKRYEPNIVAITGNVGKTSTKEAIGTVLSKKRHIRVSAGNLNNQLGLPLTILGDWGDRYYTQGSSLGFWLSVLWKGFFGLIKRINYPEILVLEYGADRPGDIKRLAKHFKPHVAVVTEISKVPVHVEYFDSPEGVALEKSKILEALGPGDYAVLNKDDDWVWLMKDKTQAHVVTFGFDEKSDIRVSDYGYWSEGLEPKGIRFRINQGEESLEVQLSGSLGKSQAMASAAAASVGLIFGLSLPDIVETLRHHHGPQGRLRILRGVKVTWILDDTYNASPASTKLALETLKGLPGMRKIAVLGDMLELGEYTEMAHREMGEMASSIADILVCVGSRSRFMFETAQRVLPQSHIYSFATSQEARLKVQEIILPGDVVLIKGSQGMRMEKIVEEIMAEPEKKNELLVRQSKSWIKK